MRSQINFEYAGKKHSWVLIHNLMEHGTSIDAAFINWSARIKQPPTIEAFCKYVTSKNPEYIKCNPELLEKKEKQ